MGFIIRINEDSKRITHTQYARATSYKAISRFHDSDSSYSTVSTLPCILFNVDTLMNDPFHISDVSFISFVFGHIRHPTAVITPTPGTSSPSTHPSDDPAGFYCETLLILERKIQLVVRIRKGGNPYTSALTFFGSPP